MVPWSIASRLRWLYSDGLARYRRILDNFETVQQSGSHLAIAEMHIKLGEPLKGIEVLRAVRASGMEATRKKILFARALWTMRLPDAAGFLLSTADELDTSYELCLELARLDHILGTSGGHPQAKQHLEAAASTLKHCIRLAPERPEAYVLHACIAVPYNEWRDLALRFYNQFEERLSPSANISLDWFTLFDAFEVSRQLGSIKKARAWLERLQYTLERSPWTADRFAFHAAAHAFRDFGRWEIYEENLQCAWLLYPSKAGELVRLYASQGRIFRVVQMLRIAYRNTDLREYRWRQRFAHVRGTAARQLLAELTGVEI